MGFWRGEEVVGVLSVTCEWDSICMLAGYMSPFVIVKQCFSSQSSSRSCNFTLARACIAFQSTALHKLPLDLFPQFFSPLHFEFKSSTG